MKYHYDSYMLYKTEKVIRNVVRAKVTMAESVDLAILEVAVNEALNRYPYFKKRVTVDADGGYELKDNDLPIVVLPTKEPAPAVGSPEVNGHLFYVDAQDKDIFFCISHTLAGGKGIQPCIMTCIYQYVTKKHQRSLYAPEVRKVDSPLLPTELSQPDLSMLPAEDVAMKREYPEAVTPVKDYMEGMYNPEARREEYYQFILEQTEFVDFCHSMKISVAEMLTLLHAVAYDRVFPEEGEVLRASLAHNPCQLMGIPDSHCDFLSHIFVDYQRGMDGCDMEQLAIDTRDQLESQINIEHAAQEVREKLLLAEAVDGIHGLAKKRAYAKEQTAIFGKNRVRSTFHLNYTGYTDWGELADYVESLVYIVDGHLLTEVSAVGDKIIFAPMTLVNAEKYIQALEKVLHESGITYELKGPFPKNLPYQDFPRDDVLTELA